MSPPPACSAFTPSTEAAAVQCRRRGGAAANLQCWAGRALARGSALLGSTQLRSPRSAGLGQGKLQTGPPNRERGRPGGHLLPPGHLSPPGPESLTKQRKSRRVPTDLWGFERISTENLVTRRRRRCDAGVTRSASCPPRRVPRATLPAECSQKRKSVGKRVDLRRFVGAPAESVPAAGCGWARRAGVCNRWQT